MEIKYNVTGDQRKELVKSISGITGVKAVYKFMPTCNYEIDYFTVTKDGTLLFDDRADSEEVERVLEGIAAAGFECEAPEGKAEEPENAAQDGSVGLTVEVPLDKVQVGNLTKLLDAKGSLIKKALGIDDLRFELLEDRIAFPWFSEPQPEETTAYTHFIAALCQMSRDAKRITAKEKPVDNEKYAFRCFLLRLGIPAQHHLTGGHFLRLCCRGFLLICLAAGKQAKPLLRLFLRQFLIPPGHFFRDVHRRGAEKRAELFILGHCLIVIFILRHSCPSCKYR